MRIKCSQKRSGSQISELDDWEPKRDIPGGGANVRIILAIRRHFQGEYVSNFPETRATKKPRKSHEHCFSRPDEGHEKATEKGYFSDTCAIPHENKAKWVRYPCLRYYLEKVLRDMGGISRWAAKIMKRKWQFLCDSKALQLKNGSASSGRTLFFVVLMWFQDHASTLSPQVCWFYFLSVGQIARETWVFLVRDWKFWLQQWEQFFASTRLSCAKMHNAQRPAILHQCMQYPCLWYPR